MPTMQEIYERYAIEYNELVSHEDYEGNLKKSLYEITSWQGKVVLETGIGTGRITELYIDDASFVYGYDRSPHMVDYARKKFYNKKDKIKIETADHLDLPLNNHPIDTFIEGWSLGHLVIENSKDIPAITKLINETINKIFRKNGISIIIETLGTNVEEGSYDNPVLNRFYKLLEEEYGYTRKVIRTDYSFNNVEEASRIMGFFFGQDMGNKVRNKKETIIPEYTGIWFKYLI